MKSEEGLRELYGKVLSLEDAFGATNEALHDNSQLMESMRTEIKLKAPLDKLENLTTSMLKCVSTAEFEKLQTDVGKCALQTDLELMKTRINKLYSETSSMVNQEMLVNYVAEYSKKLSSNLDAKYLHLNSFDEFESQIEREIWELKESDKDNSSKIDLKEASLRKSLNVLGNEFRKKPWEQNLKDLTFLVSEKTEKADFYDLRQGVEGQINDFGRKGH